MAGHGRTPKPAAVRRNTTTPGRGEWEALEATGWQHGPVPEPPDGLLQASRDAWAMWMGSWIAAHWTPVDLPGLEVLISVYDDVRRGKLQRANELRLQMDTFGLTPKGQQDRRWEPPGEAKTPAQVQQVRGRKLKAV